MAENPVPQRLQSYFYDKQIRRFLLQFTRMFSNYQVNVGTEGEPVLISVPIKDGDMSRSAAEIIANNSANSIACAPQFSFYINSLEYDRKNVQEPYHIDRKLVRQRAWNETTQLYEETEGNAFTVERHMPTPYILGLTLDYWSSNLSQKLQILEQILWIFNPSLEIQSTDNYLDWTSLSTVEIEPSIQWSSRSIPRGTTDDNEIDITSMKFKLPIWISPPARVSKGGIIHKIIANIYDDAGDMINAIQNDDILLGTRQKITPHGYQVLLIDNELQLLRVSNPAYVHNDPLAPIEEQLSEVMWRPTIDEYGAIVEGISQIRLEGSEALGTNGTEIVGTVRYHPTDGNRLLFDVDVDTLPTNTLSPVNAVINPLKSGPGAGLDPAVTGIRYLLTKGTGDIDDNSLATAWAGINGEELVADVNDIIEYNGTEWVVSFKANDDAREFVTNIKTGLQYKWDLDQWIRSYEGIYAGGFWNLIL